MTAVTSSTTPDLRFHDGFNDSTADMILLSSDSEPTGFRVQSYALRAASAVLGALPTEPLHEQSNDKLLRLTDPELECAVVLEFWLTIINGNPGVPPSIQQWKVLLRAVEFSNKYDCPTAVRLLLHEARRYLPLRGEAWQHAVPFDVFMLGAKYSDPELSASALEHGESSVWPRVDSGVMDPTVRLNALASPFDVSSWTAAELDKVESRAVIALLRATRHRQLSYKAGKHQLGSVDWKAIGQSYLKWYRGFKSTAWQEELDFHASV